MEINEIRNMECTLVEKKGISKKTSKAYRMLTLIIHTAEFGNLEVILDTRNDRTGILLDTITRKENNNG